MGKINFSQVVNKSNAPRENNGPRYFSLKNDGDEAVVRFMDDTIEDFEGYTVHTVKIGERFRDVLCLKSDAHDDVSKCPLCEAGEKLKSSLYLKLIEYTKDEQGHIVATPKIWTRPASFARKLSTYIQEYGPLSQNIFKIKRRGAKGDMATDYDIFPTNPTIYNSNIYVCPQDAFKDYTALGRQVLNKSFADIVEFLNTGNFPIKKYNEAPLPEAPAQKPTYVPQERATATQPYTPPVQNTTYAPSEPKFF